MKFKFVILSLAIILSVILCGYFIFIINNVLIVQAQGGTCDRPDLDPAPDPLISQQPSLTEVNNFFTNEANLRNWAEWVLKSIAKSESDWRQVDNNPGNTLTCTANEGEEACACVSLGADYGIMQLNWEVHNGSMDWDKVQLEYTYNITQGANVLASATYRTKVNDGDLSPTGNPSNWYTNFWRQNGYVSINNPKNPLYDPDRNWNGNKQLDCSLWDENEPRPYQEKILYAAWCDPTVDHITWPAIDAFILPDDALFEKDLDTGYGPDRDILIFDTTPITNCVIRQSTFDYTLATTEAVTTQITIRDRKPWDTDVEVIKVLPPNETVWDGTDFKNQAVDAAVYWVTVAVSNTANELIGLQSEALQFDCPIHVALPLILKNWPPVPETPLLNPIDNPYNVSDYEVTWSVAGGADSYVLEEDTSPQFSTAVTVYNGPNTRWQAVDKEPGVYYYRLKASNGWGDSAWSNTVQTTVLLPVGWQVVVSEGFEGSFPGSWTVYDNNGATDGHYEWGQRDCDVYEGSYSGWSVGGGDDGLLLSCGSNYPHKASTWMIGGPFSFRDAITAELRLQMWLQIELGIETEYLFWGYSFDGNNFSGTKTRGDTNGWREKVLYLDDVLGEEAVWIGFRFRTDETVNYPVGNYLDNITVRQCQREPC